MTAAFMKNVFCVYRSESQIRWVVLGISDLCRRERRQVNAAVFFSKSGLHFMGNVVQYS